MLASVSILVYSFPDVISLREHLNYLFLKENDKNIINYYFSISRSGLLESFARFIIEQSEIRKKQPDFKNVHFECRMVLFYMI